MNQEVDTVHVPDKEERIWGMFCHLIVFTGFIIPFASIIGPLVIWIIKRDEMPFVEDQGKESLNFQITMMLATIVSVLLMFVLIGFVLIFVVLIFQLIVVIIASIKANEGVYYRYPLSFRFIK
ncbi:MAG: DUF4870 domain-containing protein [Proteobacteria bacterium]|nr:DUF4870 domain-containing protein [Pseudomonadota bacterium]